MLLTQHQGLTDAPQDKYSWISAGLFVFCLITSQTWNVTAVTYPTSFHRLILL